MSFFKKPYDIVFYYPQHFNRSENGTNPFFDPLISICEIHKLNYLVLEEPDSKTSYPRNKKAFKFDFWFYIIIALRKIIPGLFFTTDEGREEFIGKIIAVLTLNLFNAKCYVTISNSMINVLLGFNKKSKVYDLQHGIIYSWHWGYFNQNGQLNNYLLNERIGFLVNGIGFKDVFYKNNPFLKLQKEPKVSVIGYLELKSDKIPAPKKNIVVYTLQLTSDLNENQLLVEKNNLKIFLKSVESLFVSNGLQLFLKLHPRFNNAINLSEILELYPFVKFTDDTIENLIKNTILHITQSSTSIFEFALASIPTYLISNTVGNKIFLEEYKYPSGNLEIEDVLILFNTKNQEYLEFCLKVKKWALEYYEPFNENAVIHLIQHDKN